MDERRRQVSKALSDLGHADYEIVIQKGEAVQLLLGYSLEIGADLIVVGQQDSMAHGGFGEGGAFEGLLRSSTIPFVVVSDSAPLPSDDGPFRMIVGVDGSEANADSVNGIGRIAKDLNAVTFPVLSVNTMASTTRDHYGSRLLHQDEAEAIASRLPNAEQLRTINESPVAGLIDAAEDIDADLIAIGTRGHRGFSDFFAGQLTRHVVEHSERACTREPPRVSTLSHAANRGAKAPTAPSHGAQETLVKPAIEVRGINKSFGDKKVLDAVDLQVAEGSIYGLLGPNGAGKTTLIRILTTLLKPSSGEAYVFGANVVNDAKKVRASIGLAGQFAAVDGHLTGRENLVMVGQLYNLPRAEARKEPTMCSNEFTSLRLRISRPTPIRAA